LESRNILRRATSTAVTKAGQGPSPYLEVPYGYPPEYGPEGESTLVEYWRIIRRRKGTLILITFAAAVLALLITFPQTPIYQSKTTIELLDLNTDFMNMRQMTPVMDGPQTTALSDIQTQIRILQSESLIERVMEKLKVDDPKKLSTEGNRISSWRRALNLAEPEPMDAHQAAVRMAGKNLKVRAAGQTRIIEVTVESTDARLAASFANHLTSEYIDQNTEARWKATQRTGDWLQRQMEEVRNRLEKSEDALQEYARRAGLLMVGEKESVSEEKLRQLQASLSAAQANRVGKQSRHEMAASSPVESLPEVLNDTTLRDYQGKITDLRRQMAELTTTFTVSHPSVKRVQAQLATLEGALERERAAFLRRIRNEYDEARSQEKLLLEEYTRQGRLVSQDAEKSVQYNILRREVETYRQLYEAMLQRVKEAGIASAMRASNLRVVDPAKVPLLPYKPRILLNTGLGLMGGLFLGVMFVVMRERADRTLQDPSDLPFYLGVPDLGVIPSGRVGMKRRYYLGVGSGKEPEGAGSVELAVRQKETSVLAESFRSTLTSILFTQQNGKRPKVLVLTSPNPGEGKSTVASNLAVALAEVNQRVLLIDADLRKPRQHEIFELSNEAGLSDLLRLNGEFSERVLEGAVQATSTAGMSVLVSGKSTAAAANLLLSGRMREMLRYWSERYDIILVDTPPMLQMPDARVVGRHADGVILVIRAGETTRDAAVAAKQRLEDDGTPVMGTIFNGWDPASAGAGYYGYYRGYYRSGYYPDGRGST